MIEINKNYHSDCLDLMAKMPDCFIDLVVTSPPYDDIRNYNGFSFDFESIAKQLFRVVKDGGVVVWVVSDSKKNHDLTATSFKQALYFKEVGFTFFDNIIWHKPGNPSPSAANQYRRIYEYMFVFSKGKPKTFNGIKDWVSFEPHVKRRLHYKYYKKDGKDLRSSHIRKKTEPTHLRGNVWKMNVGNLSSSVRTGHPAIFPEKLASDHIISWSNEGDLVYDPFAGSGTTLRMAKDLKRNFIGSEISKEYCEIIEKRLAQEVIL